MTHPCDACGGFAYLCGGCSGGGRYWDIRHSCVRVACPVCLGAGSFPDRMPARDAVADAETLQTVGPRIIGREPYTVIEAIRFARAAFRAVPGLRGGK